MKQKIIQILKSDVKSNKLLAWELIKSQGISADVELCLYMITSNDKELYLLGRQWFFEVGLDNIFNTDMDSLYGFKDKYWMRTKGHQDIDMDYEINHCYASKINQIPQILKGYERIHAKTTTRNIL